MNAVSEVELVTRLARLERDERLISARRRKLHERIASFPTPEHEEAECELSRQRRDLHRRIAAVQAEILRPAPRALPSTPGHSDRPAHRFSCLT